MTELFAYLLIITAAVMFASQFLFQRRYNECEGTDVYAAILFSFLTALVKIALVLVIYGFEHTFTLYGALIALLSSLASLMNVFCSAKAFLSANMSVYSMFMMLGGMVLPFAFGILWYDEPLTVPKMVCCALIAAALLLETDTKNKSSRSAVKYYIGVFITNGLSGVFAKLNQGSPSGAASSTYLMMSGIWSALICGVIVAVILLKTRRKMFAAPRSAILAAALFGTVSALGNLFVLIALETLPASVQYPMITGGTIIVSTLICLIRRETLTVRSYIAVGAAVISAIVVAL